MAHSVVYYHCCGRVAMFLISANFVWLSTVFTSYYQGCGVTWGLGFFPRSRESFFDGDSATTP